MRSPRHARRRESFEWFEGEDGNDQPVTRDTPFLIGSLANSMTAAVVLQRVNSGTLALSSPIGNHLPWLANASPTVEELLTPTSGYSGTRGQYERLSAISRRP